MPVGFALTGAKAEERTVLLGILERTPSPIGPDQLVLADKNYCGKDFERDLNDGGITLVMPPGKASDGGLARSSSNH